MLPEEVVTAFRDAVTTHGSTEATWLGLLAPIVDPGDDLGPGFHREASRLGRLSELVAEVARD